MSAPREKQLFDALAAARRANGGTLPEPLWLATARPFCVAAPRKKAGAKSTTPDEDWLLDLEADPANAGVDVRRELGKAQFWAKNNRRQCTRKFFVNWLLNPRIERVIGAQGAGASSFKRPAPDVYVEPDGWRPVAERLFPGTDIGARAWGDIGTDIRKKILEAML